MSRAGRPRSLVATLAFRIALALAGCVAIVGALATWSAKSRIDEIYDAELLTGTELLHTLIKEVSERQPVQKGERLPAIVLLEEDIVSFGVYSQWREFRIWRGSRLIARSPGGPDQPSPPASFGFVDMTDRSAGWRAYHLDAADVGVSIIVSEPWARRNAVVMEFALALIAPMLLLIPAGAGLIWLTLIDGLGALRRLAEALHTRSGGNLSLLDVGRWPRDLEATVTAINGLLDRLDRSFRRQQRFTDHAAHELRTPLAGIKLNAQLLEAESDPHQQRAIKARIREGAERGGALVEQLLSLAHLDSAAPRLVVTDVAAAAKAVLDEFAVIAAAKHVALALDAQQPVVALADALLLKMIVKNLVDNAIKHSPPGSEVAIEAAREADSIRMTVKDQGPGIPAADRERVFERFFRADSDKPGAGLGLSIVGEALSQIGGSITLETPPTGHGLWVVVRLRAA